MALVVTSHKMAFIEGNILFYSTQPGFHSNLRCETYFVKLTSEISASQDRVNEVETCVLDFSKAKIEVLGVNSQRSDWMGAFLRNRSQKVAIESI